MVTLATVRTVLVAVLVVGALGAAGPQTTFGLFGDSHDGTGSFTAADSFGGGGGGGPTADAGGPYEVFENDTVLLDASVSSTSQGNVQSYSWTITSGNGSLSTTSGAQVTYVAPADVGGDITVTVQLQVTDNEGYTDTDTAQITVRNAGSGNQPPVARFTSSRQGNGNSPNVDLDGTTSSDSDGSIASYRWEYVASNGSQVTETGPTTSDRIDAGTAVTLTVTDDDGATDTVTKTV